MSGVARRSFLKLIGVAPVAAPVVAKEAAAKMGMGTLLGGTEAAKRMYDTAGPTPIGENSSIECAPRSVAERILDYRNDLAYWRSGERRGELRRRYRRQAITLDADLASINSITPSAARSIQIERLIDEEISDHTSMIDRWISNLLNPTP